MQKIRLLYQCINVISKRQAKMLQIISSHNKSEGIQSNKIEQVKDTIWLVTSDTDTKIKYSVEKVDMICSNCALSCDKFNIYVHTFKCSCIHNVIYLNICKHIHAIAKLNS